MFVNTIVPHMGGIAANVQVTAVILRPFTINSIYSLSGVKTFKVLPIKNFGYRSVVFFFLSFTVHAILRLGMFGIR